MYKYRYNKLLDVIQAVISTVRWRRMMTRCHIPVRLLWNVEDRSIAPLPPGEGDRYSGRVRAWRTGDSRINALFSSPDSTFLVLPRPHPAGRPATLSLSGGRERGYAPEILRTALAIILAIALLTLGISPILAQTATQPAVDTIIPPAMEAPLVDWSHARLAYRMIEQWTADATLPLAPSKESIRVSGLAGVKITLRWLGLTVGSGQVTVTDLAPGSSVNLVPLIREATTQALNAVAHTVEAGEQRAASADQNPPAAASAAPAVNMAQVGPHLAIDLQLARTPEPILLAANADDAAIFYQFVPDAQGLRMTKSKGEHLKEAWMWPASRSGRQHSSQRAGAPTHAPTRVG